MLLIVTASPIVSIYLPGEWADVVPILQILAIGGAFLPQYGLISSLLQFKGESRLLLKIDACKNALILAAIAIGVQFGIQGLVTGLSLVNVLAFFAGIFIAGKRITYSFIEILKDTIPYIIISVASFAPFGMLYVVGLENIFLSLLIPAIVGSCIYLLIMKLFGSVIMEETIDFVKQSYNKTFKR
jgi:O-antigen/teichoic acid export membrane protein